MIDGAEGRRSASGNSAPAPRSITGTRAGKLIV
jgi:hypothetical protein